MAEGVPLETAGGTQSHPMALSLSDVAVPVAGSSGGVAEWLKASRLKREDRKVRGFESYPLRHTDGATATADRDSEGRGVFAVGSPHPMGARISPRVGEVAERPKATAC